MDFTGQAARVSVTVRMERLVITSAEHVPALRAGEDSTVTRPALTASSVSTASNDACVVSQIVTRGRLSVVSP